MKKNNRKNFSIGFMAVLFLWSCQKNADQVTQTLDQQLQQSTRPKSLKDLVQVNLAGDNNDFNPQSIDADLINAWGIAFPNNGPVWVSSMGTGFAKVSNGGGTALRTTIGIPSPTTTQGGHPTGVVFNTTTGYSFKLINS
jgi:hypothetical protein